MSKIDSRLDSLTLRVLKPSRRPIHKGDVFVALPKDQIQKYLFGRVISDEARIGPWESVYLVYVYDFRSDKKQIPTKEALQPSRLLIPPFMTDRLAWSKGLFETIGSEPIANTDVQPTHVFRRWNGEFVDELGHVVSAPARPQDVPGLGLTTLSGISSAIGKALAIPGADQLDS
jgi:hypothetical protein